MLNHIVLMGRLTRDPELRRTGNGKPVASFTLACERDFKNPQTGDREVDFVDCVAWNGTAELVSKYFSKGRMAVVSGRLQVRNWTDSDNAKRRNTEIIVDNIYFGDSKKDTGAGQAYAPAPAYNPAYAPGGVNDYSQPFPDTDYSQDYADYTEDDGHLPF